MSIQTQRQREPSVFLARLVETLRAPLKPQILIQYYCRIVSKLGTGYRGSFLLQSKPKLPGPFYNPPGPGKKRPFGQPSTLGPQPRSRELFKHDLQWPWAHELFWRLQMRCKKHGQWQWSPFWLPFKTKKEQGGPFQPKNDLKQGPEAVETRSRVPPHMELTLSQALKTWSG